MKKQALRTPAEMVQRGLITREEMERHLDQVRALIDQLRADYPNASFVMDSHDILRVEATEEDASEIETVLQELLTVYMPFSIQRLP